MEHRTISYVRKVSFSDDIRVHLLEKPEENDSESNTSRIDPRKAARAEAYQLISAGIGQFLRWTFEDPVDNCQENLNAYVVGVPDIHNARGLENYMLRQHKEERDGAREDVLQAVLIRQRRLKQCGSSIDVGGDEWVEKLRNASGRKSRDSKIFARRMGIADELAAQGMEDDIVETKWPTASSRPLRRSLSNDSNARKAIRQPSTRLLETATLMAKTCSRHSIQSTCSILTSRHCCNCDHSPRSRTGSSSSLDSLSTTSGIHPSLIRSRSGSNKDQALKIPGRPSSAASDYVELIQAALDLVDSSSNNQQDLGDDKSSTSRKNVARSA